MNQFLDIFYFSAIPFAAIVALGGICLKKKRVHFFVLCAALVGAWVLTIENRERRYDILNEGWFKTVDELRSALGNPDHVLYYKEGDSLWMYSVRSTPWNTVQWFSVYKNHILAKSGGRSIGLFERETDEVRDEREAILVKASLEALDKLSINQK
jgi:hypothetical protein